MKRTGVFSESASFRLFIDGAGDAKADQADLVQLALFAPSAISKRNRNKKKEKKKIPLLVPLPVPDQIAKNSFSLSLRNRGACACSRSQSRKCYVPKQRENAESSRKTLCRVQKLASLVAALVWEYKLKSYKVKVTNGLTVFDIKSLMVDTPGGGGRKGADHCHGNQWDPSKTSGDFKFKCGINKQKRGTSTTIVSKPTGGLSWIFLFERLEEFYKLVGRRTGLNLHTVSTFFSPLR